MRIAICDDDTLFIEQLTDCIRDFFRKNKLVHPEILTFTNGESLLSDPAEKDIVFLDIEMPGVSGIYTGNELKKKNRNIILFVVTAYTEYLDEAMRFHVFRYLTKPLEKQRLFRNLKDALHVYSTAAHKIPIETPSGVFTVYSSDIIFLDSAEKKVTVHTVDNDYISSRTIAEWAKVLPQNCFFQSHRSFIVNFAHVSDFDHSLIHLSGHRYSAYLTRRKYTEFKAAYLLYLESMR